MWTMWFLLGILVIVLAIFIDVLRHRQRRTFSSRLPVAVSELCGAIRVDVPLCFVIEAWMEVAGVLDLPPESLRPDDTWEIVQGPLNGVSNNVDDLVLHVGKLIQPCRCVGELVACLARSKCDLDKQTRTMESEEVGRQM